MSRHMTACCLGHRIPLTSEFSHRLEHYSSQTRLWECKHIKTFQFKTTKRVNYCFLLKKRMKNWNQVSFSPLGKEHHIFFLLENAALGTYGSPAFLFHIYCGCHTDKRTDGSRCQVALVWLPHTAFCMTSPSFAMHLRISLPERQNIKLSCY